ncbi:MAG: hypothetical protein WA268_01710 [Xanthobacteraceae bacterium]|jgi:hypothetical protein
MKLKAPPGVGDPCVAGVTIMLRDGFYDVDESIGALLVECFGFVAVAAEAKQKIATAAPRQSAPLPKLRHPAWRDQPAVKKT